jgi:outer membrane phospholipase A
MSTFRAWLPDGRFPVRCLASWLLVFCLVPGLGGVAQAQDASTPVVIDTLGVIEGIVRDARTGEPLGGATVTYACPDEQGMVQMATLRSVETVPNGRFRVEVPPGQYMLRALEVGYPVASAAVDVRSGETVQVTLRLGAEERQPAEEAMMDARMPIPQVRLLPMTIYFDQLEPNYFLVHPGFGQGESDRPPLENSNQVKFRVSLRYQAVDLLGRRAGNDSGVYLSYTQNSFWHLYDESAPFFDNNYKPAGFLNLSLNDLPGLRRALRLPEPAALAVEFGIRHESNGRDGLANRSWNRLTGTLRAGRPATSLLAGSVSLWHAWGIADENADLLDFAGRGEANLFVAPFHARVGNAQTLVLHARSRLLGKDLVSNVEVNAYYGLPSWLGGNIFTPSLVVQVFSGYAENLLTYNERRTVARFGIAVLR